ncbi:MAG: glycosyltransferase family 39 protein [Planctomycetes bacterium]|nr:glycosyltransferase family 39 protein [Planctomycetota bacterium]
MKLTGLSLIFLVAFSVRVIAGLTVFDEIVRTDSWVQYDPMWHLVQSVANGKGMAEGGTEPVSSAQPLCPLICGFVSYLFYYGDSMICFLLFNALVSALTCSLTAFLCFELFRSEKIALISGLILSFLPHQVRIDLYFQDQFLFNLFLVMSLIYTVRFFRCLCIKHAVLTGVALGLTFLTRATLQIFIVFFVFFVFAEYKKQSIKFIAITCVSFMFVLVPWGMRNYYNFGRLAFTDSDKWFSLFMAHNKYADDVITKYGAGVSQIYAQYLMEKNNIRISSDNAYEVDEFFKQKVIEYVKDNPLRTIRVILTNFFLYFSPVPLPRKVPGGISYNEKDGIIIGKELESKSAAFRDVAYALFFVPLVLLAFFGFVKHAKTDKVAWILAVVVLTQAITHAFVGPSTRYNQTANMIYAMFAAYAVYKFITPKRMTKALPNGS